MQIQKIKRRNTHLALCFLNCIAQWRSSACLLIASFAIWTSTSSAQVSGCELPQPEEQANFLREHSYGGLPAHDGIHIRRAYVFEYLPDLNVMRWAAWRANREYRVTPPRKGVLETFRSEPSITEVSYSDYVGWYDSELNFARGHMVPYFISGGDRDNDGEYAVRDPSASKPFDEYDACAVFQVNSMANIVPQRHEGFNGIGGAWNLLETDIRHLVDDGWEFNVIAGTVFVGDDVEFIHPINNSSSGPEIAVPHGFFKIVVHRPTSSAVAFLYDHTRDIPGGCKFRKKGRVWPSSCIVPIPRIEELTGLSFFGDLPSHQRRLLRETSSTRTWFRWLNSLEQY